MQLFSNLFSESLKIDIVLDGRAIPLNSFGGTAQVFDADGIITGKIKIISSGGMKIWHCGIIVSVSSDSRLDLKTLL